MIYIIRVTWYEKQKNNRLLDKEMRKVEVTTVDLEVIESIILRMYPGFCDDYLWAYTFVR